MATRTVEKLFKFHIFLLLVVMNICGLPAGCKEARLGKSLLIIQNRTCVA
jgi:hypothetical protein